MTDSYEEFKGCIRKRKYFTPREAWKELKRLRALEVSNPTCSDPINLYRCRWARHDNRHFHIGHTPVDLGKDVIDDVVILADIRQEETRLFKIRGGHR